FFFQAEDGIRAFHVTGVQTCALPISKWLGAEYSSKRAELREYDQQISALRRVLGAQPFWVEARENLARALYASGRTDEAVQEFQIGRAPWRESRRSRGEAAA